MDFRAGSGSLKIDECSIVVVTRKVLEKVFNAWQRRHHHKDYLKVFMHGEPR